MTLHSDLLTTARHLSRANPKKPRQADLRRAVSTAYYAMFHALARKRADRFVGTSANRSLRAWTHVYRAVEHGFAKSACAQVTNLGFPAGIVQFADLFRSLQEERHGADYDPDIRYTRADTIVYIANAKQAISDLRNAPRADRTAFAVLILLKRRT